MLIAIVEASCVVRVKIRIIARHKNNLYFCKIIINEQKMNTKLTLTIEQTVIEQAKKYSKAKGRSLSDIVESYFKAIVKDEGLVNTESTPIAHSLRGSFKEPSNFDYKKELTEALTEKYL